MGIIDVTDAMSFCIHTWFYRVVKFWKKNNSTKTAEECSAVDYGKRWNQFWRRIKDCDIHTWWCILPPE